MKRFYARGVDDPKEICHTRPDGSTEVITFEHGYFDTDDELTIAFLTRLVDAPGMPVEDVEVLEVDEEPKEPSPGPDDDLGEEPGGGDSGNEEED